VRRAGLRLLLAWALLAGAPARAEIVRSEGEGAAPIAAGAAAARASALEAALSDAVWQVAARLAGAPSSPAAEQALRAALGPSPSRLAQGYRELDQYERPGPEGRELGVRVEARVDAGAVAEALRRAGLLAAQAEAPGLGASARVVVEPLPAWPALAAVRRRLLELGARRVAPERAEPEHVVLSIESDRSSRALVDALVASPPPGVAVISIGERNGVPAIRLEAAPGAFEPIDTPAAKR
jgi:hypothetical protein